MNSRDGFPRAGHPGEPRPADLTAVERDDALLDRIGAGEHPTDVDPALVHILAGWRTDVHHWPDKQLIDTATAEAFIAASARQRRQQVTNRALWPMNVIYARTRPRWIIAAGVTAVIVFCLWALITGALP